MMALERDPIEGAILQAVPSGGAGVTIGELFGTLTATDYRPSRVSAALLTLMRERRVELTADRRVRQRSQEHALAR